MEHLFAALAGLGVHRGVRLDLQGEEIPLACGSAQTFVHALQNIGAGGDPDRDGSLVVARDAIFEAGDGFYRFKPGRHVNVGVTLSWPYPYLSPRAVWHGEAEDFASRIAPARTFGLEHEARALVESGLAQYIDPASVVLVTPDGLLAQGARAENDEPARHKLLDVIGDLYLYGGPPRGSVEVHRPSHARTHDVALRALASGVLVRVRL